MTMPRLSSGIGEPDRIAHRDLQDCGLEIHERDKVMDDETALSATWSAPREAPRSRSV
jgi:hypothetical protein